MLALHRFRTEPHSCAYLPDRQATLEYTYAAAITPAEYERLMDRGYRKFGALLFRPVCAGCRECRPIRIPVAGFRPDRSQRRAWKRYQPLEIRHGPPALDTARMELYTRYHSAQAERKGWTAHDRDFSEYEFTFVRNPLPSVEISMWEGGSLRAIVLTDVTPNVVSGIYHYYEPEVTGGLGTFCMLHTIELARALGRRYAYFGFYVRDCGSLAYKARFRPCELMGTDGVWRPG